MDVQLQIAGDDTLTASRDRSCNTESAPLLPERHKVEPAPPMRHSAVDSLFVRRLARLYGTGLARQLRSVETALLVVLLMLAVGNEVLTYFVGMLPSQLIVGLIQRDTRAFFSTLWRAALFTISEAFIISLIAWLTAVLALRWRRNLVRSLHERYLQARRFHAVNQLSSSQRLDNPDQRVVQDAMMLCTSLATIVKSVAVPFVIIFYTWRVWALLGWSGPLTYLYFAVGSVCNTLLMSRVSRFVWLQEKLEGHLRFGHARLRAHAEQIALYEGGAHELATLNVQLSAVLRNMAALLRSRMALDVATNTFQYAGGFISYVVVGIALTLGGAFDAIKDPALFAGTLQMASFLVIMLISGFSTVVGLASATSDLAGFTTRVAELDEALDEPLAPDARLHCVDAVALVDVTLCAPTGLRIVEALSFRVPLGASLLITGPSGSGKSSIVRALSGLWPVSQGHVHCPTARDQFCFVPQQSYLVAGSLADQLQYPHTNASLLGEDGAVDGAAVRQLAAVGLGYLAARYHMSDERDWSAILSPGEQQKLGIARLLARRPLFCVLDESTSALSLSDEAALYKLIREAGITIISVGHRPSLLPLHSMHLALDGTGAWHLSEVN